MLARPDTFHHLLGVQVVARDRKDGLDFLVFEDLILIGCRGLKTELVAYFDGGKAACGAERDRAQVFLLENVWEEHHLGEVSRTQATDANRPSPLRRLE